MYSKNETVFEARNETGIGHWDCCTRAGVCRCECSAPWNHTHSHTETSIGQSSGQAAATLTGDWDVDSDSNCNFATDFVSNLLGRLCCCATATALWLLCCQLCCTLTHTHIRCDRRRETRIVDFVIVACVAVVAVVVVAAVLHVLLLPQFFRCGFYRCCCCFSFTFLYEHIIFMLLLQRVQQLVVAFVLLLLGKRSSQATKAKDSFDSLFAPWVTSEHIHHEQQHCSLNTKWITTTRTKRRPITYIYHMASCGLPNGLTFYAVSIHWN